jgi:uncharacterized phage protein (TIGR01671 family)
MRQHKYRIWDKQQNKFHTDRDWGLSLDGTHIIGFSSHDSWDQDKGYKIKLTDNFVVQDFIGLLDKHGKEIYKGDIVLYRKQNREVRIGEFCDGADDRVGVFLQCPKIKHRNFGTNKLSAFNSCEVIGNIFENPDLLK